MERVESGELIGYIIIIVGALGALAFVFQLISLVLVRLAVSNQLKNLDRPTANNPLGRVLLAFKGDKAQDRGRLRRRRAAHHGSRAA